jgi:glycerol-1-phosphate dehydrogenase [NAD(P)+]
MDGYASSSSSMTVGGLKKSVPSKIPDVIIGDTEILATAPKKMLLSGVGDMLAKYVGLAEWRIGKIVRDEYFCEKIYEFMKSTLMGVVDTVKKYGTESLPAIENVFRGLVCAGFAMSYANSTRPASGADH